MNEFAKGTEGSKWKHSPVATFIAACETLSRWDRDPLELWDNILKCELLRATKSVVICYAAVDN